MCIGNLDMDHSASPAANRHRSSRALLWSVLLVGITAVLVLTLVRSGLIGKPTFHGTTYNPPMAAPEFVLTSHTGEAVRMSDFRGTPVLLFFGYTHCPDVCPLTLSKLSRVLDSLDASPEDVRVLLVTVDPERDTPAVMAEYVPAFGPHALGLTGERAVLEEVWAGYGVYSQPMHGGHGEHAADAAPMVSHTTPVFGIDRAGQLRVLIHGDQPDEVMRDDVRALLRL
jgi:protein SCO1/2